jgi:signal transduction histidine kinase
MDIKTFDYLAIAQDVATNPNWRAALDDLVHTLREGFIFDNLAIFLAQGGRVTPDVVFARAVGRGLAAEADAAWGEEIANKVFLDGELVLKHPLAKPASRNRLEQPYLLGVPLRTPEQVIGAVVFVRFGGPPYEEEHIRVARFVAAQVGLLLERRALIDIIGRLDAAQRQLQFQEDFIATISHELRTPLGFIKGYSTTLLRTDTQWDAATQREFLTIIDEEADHLSELIESVLESARLESGTLPMNFQPVRLGALVRDIASRYQARYKDLEVKLEASASPQAEADAVRLSQVIDNLFNNALKYAPGAPISIHVTKEGEQAQICFSDAGPGIPPQSLPFVFDRFYRVPGEGTLKRSGTGLGLYICKKIIEAHHGTISVESRLGAGTTFYIDLPIYRPAK